MPYILSPAGSPEALYAALDAGADEVYFGLWKHNARQGAQNFTKETAAAALRDCKLRGVKTNIALNTLVTDREIPEALQLAYEALCMGADAFIVQDLGLARALKKAFPSVVLHASTQCVCHSVSGAEMLMQNGFSRVVLARELDKSEIEQIVKLGCETEVFVHGALCVCHSGLCLMSSVIGKRSGNRGECAQPCRLPFQVDNSQKSNGYALSLKDLTLSAHVPELTALGITSLKIEGRMKPPAYVAGVTHIWKTLISENRPATLEELNALDALFSRSGFTDGYFTGEYRKNNRSMYGIRTEADKDKQINGEWDHTPSLRKVSMKACFKAEHAPTLYMTCSEEPALSVNVTADFTAQAAQNAPTDPQTVRAALSKLGGTAFVCDNIDLDMDGALFLAKSQLNRLRRLAVEALEAKILAFPLPENPASAQTHKKQSSIHKNIPVYKNQPAFRLFPTSKASLEEMLATYEARAIESVCLPLGWFLSHGVFGNLEACLDRIKQAGIPYGVRMPHVIFTAEEQAALKALDLAKEKGTVYAQAENIGDVRLISKAGLTVYAGASLNIYNSETLAVLAESGVSSAVLSPELMSAQMRDMVRIQNMTTARIGAGRLELMVLESCVVHAGQGCRKTADGEICAVLTDRKNARFPVRAEHRFGENPFPCRNVILNSVPTVITEKPEEIVKSGVDVVCIYPG